MEAIDPFVFRLSIFVLAIFVGYFVVWSVTPALHTPLMSVTNAISSVIVVGALIAASVSTTAAPTVVNVAVDFDGSVSVNGQRNEALSNARSPEEVRAATQEALAAQPATSSAWISKILGFVALSLASVNIFGGFLVTQRMLGMYKKKDKAPGAGTKH